MSTASGDETPNLLISAFPKGKFGSRGVSQHANKPADSNFPLSVTMHINEVDGLMPHFSNGPLGEHWLSLLCSDGTQLIASEAGLRAALFFHLNVFAVNGLSFLSGKQLKPTNRVILR